MTYQTVYKAMMKTAADGAKTPQVIDTSKGNRTTYPYGNKMLDKLYEDAQKTRWNNVNAFDQAALKESGPGFLLKRIRFAAPGWVLHSERKDSIRGLAAALQGRKHTDHIHTRAPILSLGLEK